MGTGAMSEKQAFPSSITGKGAVAAGSVLDHAFGSGEPYTLGVEEEYQLLDGEGFDLVQHIDTMLAAVSGHELEPRINPELMQSVLEITTPVCRTAGDVERELVKLRSYVTGVAREQGMRVGSSGTHPFSLFERQRITAKDRYRKLIDQMQYVARRELIFGMHVHVAIDDPGEGDPGGERPPPPSRTAARAVRELPVLARRADRPGVEQADGLLRLPALRAASSLPRLRGLCGGRGAARALGLHRRLHAHLVGHPPAPASRHDRGPHLRRRDPRGGRNRDHPGTPRPLPPANSLGRSTKSRRGDPADYRESPPARTSGSPPGTGSRPRSWTSPLDAGTACPSRD